MFLSFSVFYADDLSEFYVVTTVRFCTFGMDTNPKIKKEILMISWFWI